MQISSPRRQAMSGKTVVRKLERIYNSQMDHPSCKIQRGQAQNLTDFQKRMRGMQFYEIQINFNFMKFRFMKF